MSTLLTSKGLEAFKSWLECPIEQLPVERTEILLKLFFGRYQFTRKDPPATTELQAKS